MAELPKGSPDQAALVKAGVGNNDLIGLNFGGERTVTVKRCAGAS